MYFGYSKVQQFFSRDLIKNFVSISFNSVRKKALDAGSREKNYGRDYNAKVGPSTSSSNGKKRSKPRKNLKRDSARYESDRSEDYDLCEYFSDENLDLSKYIPCSSICSLKRLKGIF